MDRNRRNMKISQSLIKDILPFDFCPHYIHLKYNVGLNTPPTEAMENGLFFESELLGSARGGKFELPKKSNGDPYKRELDILENVAFAKDIFTKLNIDVKEVQPHKKRDNRSGHFDFTTNKIIGDVKWTGMSKDKFLREFKYKLKYDYKIQANHYQSIEPNKDFIFFIFGKSNWFEAIRFRYDQDEINEHIINFSDVAQEKYNNLKEYEINPTFDNCNSCRLKEHCKKRNTIPEIKDYDEY